MVAVLLMASSWLLAGVPDIVNARIEQLRPEGSLRDWIPAELGARPGPAWLAYSVPMIESGGNCCCDQRSRSACRLESGVTGASEFVEQSPAATPRVGGELLVFLRASNGRVERLRFFSSDCRIDGGGGTVLWLGGVDPVESLSYLDTFVASNSDAASVSRRLVDGAVAAIAFHAASGTFAQLDGYLDAERYPEHVRKQTVFWMGTLYQPESLPRLREAVTDDPSRAVRKQAVFAISLGSDDPSTGLLIELARASESPEIRKTALFWLGQKAGRRASEALTGAVESDPDVEVRKGAVFGLSQLPPEEGIPLLIHVARTNRTPAVRKAAMFWLGQSDRPEVLDFFEEILRTP